MKFIKLFLIMTLSFCMLTSCKKKPTEVLPEPLDKEPTEPVIKPVETTPFEEVKTYVESVVPSICDKSITLPTTYEDKNITITWESSNTKVLNNNGQIVRRPDLKETITLSYTIKNENNEEKTYTIETNVYTISLSAIENEFVTQFPDEIEESINYVETEFFEYFKVSWTSSDTSCFTNNGEYIKPDLDTEITISYTITLDDKLTLEGEVNRIVLGATNEEKVERVSTWLLNEHLTELKISKDINLPEVDPVYQVALEWETSNPDVITKEGKVKQYVFDRYVEIRCKVKSGNVYEKHTFWFVVEAKDITKLSKVEMLEDFLSAIALSEINNISFTAYQKISQSYNSFYFFDSNDVKRIESITPTIYDNRPGIIKTSTEFIVVHDTANTSSGANAGKHAAYVNAGGGGVSFHYCVGNDGVYHLIPDDEVAFHAGDGRRLFELIDTGVLAKSKLCNIAISDDGYYTFNGVKSKVSIPAGCTKNSKICDSGIYYEIGENGNYFINQTYFNTDYNTISNQGGNRNSIGIETCVDPGSDYLKTLRYNADLVAILLMENNLDVSRVVQHNNMSGKNCPFAMRSANYWQIFRDMVSLELFGKTHFKDLTFDWKSNSEILSNDGYIERKISGIYSLEYSVQVRENDTVLLTKEYSTKLLRP